MFANSLKVSSFPFFVVLERCTTFARFDFGIVRGEVRGNVRGKFHSIIQCGLIKKLRRSVAVGLIS